MTEPMTGRYVIKQPERGEYGDGYSELEGPNGWSCFLGEPEDCSWGRDGSGAVKELNRLDAEVERLRAELKEYLEMAFCSMAKLCKGGEHKDWWSTRGLGDVRRMGDRLVDMGIFERHPDGQLRCQWYRPLREAPLIEQSLKHVGTPESPTPLGDQTPFKEHLDASSATVAEWPGWKRDVLRKEPTDEKKIR